MPPMGDLAMVSWALWVMLDGCCRMNAVTELRPRVADAANRGARGPVETTFSLVNGGVSRRFGKYPIGVRFLHPDRRQWRQLGAATPWSWSRRRPVSSDARPPCGSRSPALTIGAGERGPGAGRLPTGQAVTAPTVTAVTNVKGRECSAKATRVGMRTLRDWSRSRARPGPSGWGVSGLRRGTASDPEEESPS